jgi:hypothetical protein
VSDCAAIGSLRVEMAESRKACGAADRTDVTDLLRDGPPRLLRGLPPLGLQLRARLLPLGRGHDAIVIEVVAVETR